MNGSLPWIVFVFGGATIIVIGFIQVIVGAILAPMIIAKADKALGVLMPTDEQFFQGLPISFNRLASYGRIILLRNTGWYRRHVFHGRSDRERAVRDAPRWLKNVAVGVYAGSHFACAVTIVWAGFLFLLD
ncbi:hypothetical protein F0A16_16590 [Salinicola corii]|uniref:Uncharacterized protein n=1 Tax=Salinicola corii TaxID=2606937 RepID=A0A640W9M3_9GAMM|nr:hypothetical protein [Salinicola corii]KAA0016691.1 hypothetical protein F0A16_16590 [Salinicola corii]